MRLFTTRVLSFALLAATLAGCSKNPVIQLPPPPAARMYVADFNNGLVGFGQPLGPASAPLFTLGANQDSDVAFDSAGNLYVSHYNAATIDVYKQPISATSTPSFTIGPVAISNISGIGFDAAGNLWGASELSDELFMIAPPFAGGAITPTYFTSASFTGPVDIAFDRAGDLLVPEYGGANLLVFRPPFAFPGPSVPNAIIALPAFAGGLGIDKSDHLIIGLADGRAAILSPPFATGNVPSGFIAAPILNGGPGAEALHSGFDASDNLYVPYGNNGGPNSGIGVYAPPFTSASVPTFVINTGAGSGLSWPFGVAFGQ